MRKLLGTIPGFRTNTPWKKVIAIIGYTAIALFLISGAVGEDRSGTALIGLGLLAIVLIASNAWGIRNRLPLFKSPSRWTAAGGWAIFLLVWFTVIAATAPPVVKTSQATTRQAITSPTPKPTPTQTATPTPSPTPTPTPTPTPKPSSDPHLLTVANVTQSVNDNKNFDNVADFSNMQVSLSGGTVNIQVKPQAWDEQYAMTMAAANALVASKAIFGWYPNATYLVVSEMGDVTDRYGNKSAALLFRVEISAGTAAKFNYAGLKDRVFADPSVMFCDADHYMVAPFVWSEVKTGCMTSPTR